MAIFDYHRAAYEKVVLQLLLTEPLTTNELREK